MGVLLYAQPSTSSPYGRTPVYALNLSPNGLMP